MHAIHTGLAITILFVASLGVAQECPVKDDKAAAQFLLDHKSNSKAADRFCVDGAFSTLTLATRFENKNYVQFLVEMLDFERWTPEEYAEAGEQKYPAKNDLYHLYHLNSVDNSYHENSVSKKIRPSLIKAIRESDSERLRTNAAELLGEIDHCWALMVLARQTEKSAVYEQTERLEEAAKYIRDRSDLSPACEEQPFTP